MSQHEAEPEPQAEDEYDPFRYARGAVSGQAEKLRKDPGEDSDVQGDDLGDGLWSMKQHQYGVTFNGGGWLSGALYGHFCGLPSRDRFRDATEIRVWFNGEVTLDGEDFYGDWVAIIKGRRLERVHDHLREGRRISVNVTGPVADTKKAEVLSIEIRPHEPREVERA